MKNILVTSCSAKVLLIQSLVKCSEKYNIRVIATDITEDKPALYFAHGFSLLPPMSDPHYVPKLLDLCKRENIGYIIPTRDDDLVWFAKNKEKLNSASVEVCQSSGETINICNDKIIFHEFCLEHGLPVPKNYDNNDLIKYPCVFKLRESSASKGVKVIHSESELLAEVENANELGCDFMVQEYLSDKEYTIDAFYNKEGKLIIAIPRERVKVVNGESIISKTVDVPELSLLARNLGEYFEFFGHVTIQAFYSSLGDINLIEINPRFGGASNLGFAAGVKSPDRLLAILAGDIHESESVKELKYGLKMLRYSTDLIIQD
ncbi:ATP-grasp domain-containing protein [Kluyvera cryocrescens]|uniref:ATP-grasp domain-containing protein n=1 Tax=Kluyvera cryocrescens TaxID=580 RepID=UPI0039F71E52